MTHDLEKVALTLVADGKGEMEDTQVSVASPPHRREWHED